MLFFMSMNTEASVLLSCSHGVGESDRVSFQLTRAHHLATKLCNCIYFIVINIVIFCFYFTRFIPLVAIPRLNDPRLMILKPELFLLTFWSISYTLYWISPSSLVPQWHVRKLKMICSRNLPGFSRGKIFL